MSEPVRERVRDAALSDAKYERFDEDEDKG